YHALIRRYKPEQAPEEFRRIREAYETVSQYVEWREQYGGSDEVIVTTNAPATAIDSIEQSTPAAPIDDPARDWNEGIDGDLVVLYRKLIDWLPRRPNEASLYARLYWLLRLAPECDSDRTPAEWLVEGLSRMADTPGPLVELYRRVLDADPQEALSAGAS